MKKYISGFALLLFFLLLLSFAVNEDYSVRTKENLLKEKQNISLHVGCNQQFVKEISSEDIYKMQIAIAKKEELLSTKPPDIFDEEDVYSFSQGPRAWRTGLAWSGEWCYFSMGGNYFGNFGCGLCCMANIYDSLTPYEISPWQMCTYASQVSGYAPEYGTGAIGWEYIKKTLQVCGFSCELYTKPGTYEAFQAHMKEIETAIVLICSSNDDTYWEDTSGHYVNIWLYEEETDTIFLADPGKPENNRNRIPLRYIYDALKTASKYQYLAVDTYIDAENLLRADGITENWNRP